MRVKGGTVSRARRKKMIKLAKGYRGQRHINYKVAKQQVWKGWVYAFRDRKATKRNFRKLWITRINAAARMNGLSYSRFMNGLALMGSKLNRKMLADLAVTDAKAFTALTDAAKKALTDNGQAFHEVTPATLETEVTVTVAEPKPAKKAEVSAEKPSDKNTVAEIKAYLDAQNVEYASSAKKADLLALV
ncbi:50S ribosomal protein L20 [Weissella diestrammenae]|uniref:Large ribosomal subunit protein bL20 n=1 Tax=Weissella diestrammenae TaxID=1162633 RepID=A0A7G9T6C9_9LACO|nr:50S ribosomal protein L20 [Weissella diestrammenae]QNN75654.1 50S ribosomal protein L20 [Weissella diestrammenae]